MRTTRSGAGEQSGHSNELDCLQDWVTPYSLTVNHYIWYKTVFITHFSTPCSLSGSLKKDLVCKKGDYAFPSYLLKTSSEFKINCPWCIFLLTKWTFIFSELDIWCTHDGCLICYSSHHFNNSWNLLIQLENTPKMKLVTLNQLLFLMHSYELPTTDGLFMTDSVLCQIIQYYWTALSPSPPKKPQKPCST